MKNISLFLFLTAVLIFIAPVHAQDSSAIRIRDGVFIHLSHGSDSPHRLLMALKMAVTMAEGQKDVFIYCDIEAVKVLTRAAKNVSMEGFPALYELLTRLSELKVPIVACPTCMKIAGIAEQDLRPGVKVAQRDLFFSFTKGRILSLDY
jgi:predicted peroxiredoxin